MPKSPAKRVDLQFQSQDALEHIEEPVRRDISAAAVIDRTLFLACDETSSIERLTLHEERFGDHVNVNLSEFFDLPNGPEGEMDIEGLAIDGGYLWITGSHSLKRDKPDVDENDCDEALRELTDLERDANRFFFGRIPLQEEQDGVYALAKKAQGEDGVRRAAAFKCTRKSSVLTRILEDDVHFGPFLDVPAKENGFDIEGLAVRGDRVLLGLRGPVLRGWAIVLELLIKSPKKSRLKPRRFGERKLRYAKHFLDLDGLGVRDLLLEGEDLLILAGPTMDLDGPAAVYRWREALRAPDHSITPRSELEIVMELPCGKGADHPESMVVWRHKDGRRLLVVYDSPAEARLKRNAAITADVFTLN